LLFNANLKALTIAETRNLAEYIIQQSGCPLPELDVTNHISVETLKPLFETQIRVAFML